MGKIISGQETPAITVRQADGLTATVDLSGLPLGCDKSASASAIPWDPPPAILADEYSNISQGEKAERLKSFAEKLQNDPTATALITRIFPRRFNREKIYSDLRQTLKYLENHFVDAERVSFGIKYGREEKTTLWIIPAGAFLPKFEGEILTAKNLKEKSNSKSSKNQKTSQQILGHLFV